MRLSALAPRNTRQLLSLLSAALMLMVFAGPAVAQAAESPASTAPSGAAQEVTTSSTTAAGQDVTSPVTASTTPDPRAQAGQAAVIPPAAGLVPLNPGWKAGQMDVDVWPEYDKEAVLVFMRFSLPAEVPLPATFKFAIPTGAVIAGIGEIDPNGSYKFNYADSYPPVQPGANWDIATIQVQDFRSLQIDYYYDPGLPAGAGERSFPLLLQLPLDVGTLALHVQQPAGATDFTVQPDLQGSGAAQDGFTYAVATFNEVKAGSTLGHLVSYSKPDGALSADPGQSDPAQVGTRTVLLTAILVIVVGVGGFLAYYLYRKAGRDKQSSRRPRTKGSPAAQPVRSPTKRPVATTRKKPAPKGGNAATDRGEAVDSVCVACGEALRKKDRFCPSCGEAPRVDAVESLCVACGEELRKKDRFCPSCGEAREG